MSTPSSSQAAPRSVGLLLVATGRYRQFVPQLLASASHHVQGLDRIFLFSDERPDQRLEQEANNVVWLPWGHTAWPLPTLLRYRAFSAYREILESVDALLYADVDMTFLADVKLGDVRGLLGVRHPGYVGRPVAELPYERRLSSHCQVPVGMGDTYFCGGVQGGATRPYLDACSEMASWIQADIDRNITPTWHDESAWNRYCALNPPATVWGPEYCSPEHERNPEACIIALDKDHDLVRETPWLRRRAARVRHVAGRARRAAVKVSHVARPAR